MDSTETLLLDTSYRKPFRGAPYLLPVQFDWNSMRWKPMKFANLVIVTRVCEKCVKALWLVRYSSYRTVKWSGIELWSRHWVMFLSYVLMFFRLIQAFKRLLTNFNVRGGLRVSFLSFQMFDELYKGQTRFTLEMSGTSSMYNMRLLKVKIRM